MSLRYTSADEDSARWDAFEVRDGDLVVSTRSKHGTTWMQTILLALIHGPPPFPAPLGQLSPWLDHLVEPLEVVLERLQAQPHRRVIKTHTPLDGIPLDARATYIVVARHPPGCGGVAVPPGGQHRRRPVARPDRHVSRRHAGS